jgi:hypothetical protein
MIKKLLAPLCVVAIAVIAFALGDATDSHSQPATTSTVLSGRTEQNRPFVTELDAGWFDTNVYAPCSAGGDRHYDFVWTAEANGTQFKWDGRHLTARAEGVPTVGDHYTARLDATYDPETGLRGTMQIVVRWEGDTCRSGAVEFWAVADR